VDGYWDYPLANRGLLFAPVYIRPAYRIRPQYVYSPLYVVPVAGLQASLFVRRGYGSYYYGDYYTPTYYNAGYSSWAGITIGNVTVGVARRQPIYDPLWGYYSVQHRNNPQWTTSIIQVNTGRYQGTVPRPPHTLVQQTTVINNITNNTVVNNTTVNNTTVNKNTVVASTTLAASIADVKKTNTELKFKAVPQQERVQEQQHAKELRQVALERRKIETNLVAKGQVPTKATDAPQTVKLEFPRQSFNGRWSHPQSRPRRPRSPRRRQRPQR